MSSSTIFFSYGRENSAFVLDLAKELRKSGANIWLDQLDIAPGTRWDRSIEKALKVSDTLLVVLSKDSVTSNNVMDEVSYALEENKTVVPVLMEACEIPFRLRRLQYADFTENHKTGIETLIKTLRLDDDVVSKLSDIAANDDDLKEDIEKINKLRREQDTKLKQDRLKETQLRKEVEKKARLEHEKEVKKSVSQPIRPATNKNSGTSAWLIAGITLFVVGGLFAFIVIVGLASDPEDNFTETESFHTPSNHKTTNNIETASPNTLNWSKALKINTMESYLTYIDTYGQTDAHFVDAIAGMDALLKYSGYMQYATADGSIRYFNRLNIVEGIDSYPQANDFIISIAPGYVRKTAAEIEYNAKSTDLLLPAGKYMQVTNVLYPNGVPWVQVRYGD